VWSEAPARRFKKTTSVHCRPFNQFKWERRPASCTRRVPRHHARTAS
jgi:hypothetical protein